MVQAVNGRPVEGCGCVQFDIFLMKLSCAAIGNSVRSGGASRLHDGAL